MGKHYMAKESAQLAAFVYLKSCDILFIKYPSEFFEGWSKYLSNLPALEGIIPKAHLGIQKSTLAP